MLMYMKHSYYRFAFMVVGSVVVLVMGVLIFAIYAEGHKSDASPVLKEVEDMLQKEKQMSEGAVENDTQGSSTPKGTLTLYIAALEKKNDQEAISYFVSGRQEMERERLSEFSESVRIHAGTLLKQAMNATGTYSQEGDAYTIRTPVLVDFIRLPNGTWKLVEL